MNDFEKCIKITASGDRLTIACKLGWWSVSGPVMDAFKINDEAMHYFMQYKKDGEYNKLLEVDNMPLLGDDNDIDLKMYNMTGSLDP